MLNVLDATAEPLVLIVPNDPVASVLGFNRVLTDVPVSVQFTTSPTAPVTSRSTVKVSPVNASICPGTSGVIWPDIGG